MKILSPSSPASAAPQVTSNGVRSKHLSVLAVLTAGALSLGYPAAAAAKVTYAGMTNLLVNDTWGDGDDRWQTGSFQQSVFTRWENPGVLDYLEWTGRAKVVTPWNKQKGGVDRPYSASYGLGLFAHNMQGNWYSRIGGEVIIQGKQTGLHNVQKHLHRLASYRNGYEHVEGRDQNVDNKVSGRLKIETGYALRPAANVQIRPYIAANLGGDNAVYLGTDLIIGKLARADIWNRDMVTGQLLTPKRGGGRTAFSLIAGADVSRVESSIHLPDTLGVAVEQNQSRARIGVRADLGNVRFFLGQAWLSRQFVGQAEAQRVGMVSLSLGF